MTGMRLFSEPFAPTGNLAAEGFRNLLGKPTLDQTQTVIREAIQNSVDAAESAVGPRIEICFRTLSESQLTALRQDILADLPADDLSRSRIIESISKERVTVLEIADFNTSGLGGPLSADEVPLPGEQPDFVNFVRNIGAARDTHQGGGTYGYGKTSLFTISSCATIIVDSTTRYHEAPQRRLIACHLGAAFESGNTGERKRRYTGRHWWGVVGSDGNSVDPATGKLADDIAERIGFPDRKNQEMGTSILMLDPRIDTSDPEMIGNILEEVILWNFWPRMVDTTPVNRKLNVELKVEGQSWSLSRPEDYPPLDHFSRALNAIRDSSGEVSDIACGSPRKHLGKLAMSKGVVAARKPSALRPDSIIPRQSSLIALMRPVELVVKYLPGQPFPDPRYEWGGVFICSDDDEVEQAFASSEPPAHDDWIYNNLPKGRAKTFVKVALERLREIAVSYVAPGNLTPGGVPGRVRSLAKTASRMGALLDNISAKGPGRESRPPRSSPPRKPKGLSVTPAVFDRLEADGSTAIAVFVAHLSNDESNPGAKLVAEAHLVTDGAAISVDDLSSEYTPKVRSLRFLDNERMEKSDRALVGTEKGRVEIEVQVPSDAAVGLKLRIEDL
jgi:hypothetical protein